MSSAAFKVRRGAKGLSGLEHQFNGIHQPVLQHPSITMPEKNADTMGCSPYIQIETKI
jgi:hypothetical protein